jgi:hypothetical protein
MMQCRSRFPCTAAAIAIDRLDAPEATLLVRNFVCLNKLPIRHTISYLIPRFTQLSFLTSGIERTLFPAPAPATSYANPGITHIKGPEMGDKMECQNGKIVFRVHEAMNKALVEDFLRSVLPRVSTEVGAHTATS